jgi:hypothetical protein
MSLAELLAEAKRLGLRISLIGNGPAPALNIEPKDRITPALLAAFTEHKAALIDMIHRGRTAPSVFDLVRACLAGLPDLEKKAEPGLAGLLGGEREIPPSLEVLAGPLRYIASLVADVDAVDRALIRGEVITALEARKVRAPAKLVDAAFAGIPLKEEGETAGRRLVLTDIPPWPDPVDGAALLDELAKVFRRFVILPTGAAETLALWVVHSHALDALDLSPYLALTSPEKRCGKTTTLTLLHGLVPRPVPASNITAAALFRAVEKYTPTLLVDEADTFLADYPELRGILNSGHTRATAFAVRTVGDEHEAKTFSTFCAKVVAIIGGLPGTLEDRSIVLGLRRKSRKESVERVRLSRLAALLEPIARRAARWAKDHLDAIRDADPALPEEINSDRSRDNWRPLLAIADLAGGDWPLAARGAALDLAGAEAEDTGGGVLLLADLRDCFDRVAESSMATRDIIAALTAMDERPWPTHDHGKPIAPNHLAVLLRPFGIRPKLIRAGAAVSRGYLKEDFGDAWARYLPPQSGDTGS